MEEKNLSFDIEDIDQWLDRLSGVVQRGANEWFALCPAHEDRNPSLSVCDTGEGCLVHCFAGCSFGDIVQAVDQIEVTVRSRPAPSPSPITKISSARSGHALWVELFGFSVEDLDPFFVGGIERHIKVDLDRLEFRWPSSQAVRYRLANSTTNEKGYVWGKDSSHPPLWPEIESKMDEMVYLTEGESDCIVLRRCGLSAYALTTGGSRSSRPRFSKTVIRDLMVRGVKKIYLAFDDDDVGHQTATVVYNQILELEKTLADNETLEVAILPISNMALAYLGEKDLRQIWLRIRDVETFAAEFRDLKSSVDKESDDNRLWSVQDYLKLPHEPLSWIVEGALQRQGIAWISGFPKMGKSWVALDLAFSIATGSQFLNHFDVGAMGDVVYVVKENSDASLVSRVSRLMKKKAPIRVHVSKGNDDYDFAAESSVMIDASREFRFEPTQVESLIHKVVRHQKHSGRTVRAIIIDPLSFSLPPGRFDINTFTDFQREIVDQMAHIVRRTGASVVVVHHQSKGDNNTMLGSVAAEASFDNKIMFVTKNRGFGEYLPGDPVRMQMIHRDGISKTYDFQMEIDDNDGYQVHLSPVSDEDVRSGQVKIKISYLDRQKSVVSMIENTFPKLKPEFTWKEFEGVFRADHDTDEVSSSLLTNTFSFIQNGAEALIEQHRRGIYRRKS